MDVRSAHATELDALARLWHEAWHDAHAPIVPPELTRARTLENFRERLTDDLPDLRVVGAPGAPLGFCVIKGTELYQLFVVREARGTGVAAALIADGEARLAARGVHTAWLACAIGNDRAARFYEKHGWQRAGTTTISDLEIPTGVFQIEVWRYEKRL